MSTDKEGGFILCLETSGKVCSVALFKDNKLLNSAKTLDSWQHSSRITLLIEECLNKNDCSIQNLSAVALSAGPGSYTGLRVGASTAKGICYALEIPLIAVSTLKTIAFPHLTLAKKNNHGAIIPLIDARRQEVYCSIYNSDLIELESVDARILDQYSYQGYNHPILCGDGAEKAEEIIGNTSFSYIKDHADASNMGQLAWKKFTNQDFEDLAYFNPFYFKAPNITKSKKKLF